jgi:hypothetical protein
VTVQLQEVTVKEALTGEMTENYTLKLMLCCTYKAEEYFVRNITPCSPLKDNRRCMFRREE